MPNGVLPELGKIYLWLCQTYLEYINTGIQISWVMGKHMESITSWDFVHFITQEYKTQYSTLFSSMENFVTTFNTGGKRVCLSKLATSKGLFRALMIKKTSLLQIFLNQRTEGTDRKVKLFCGKTLPLSEWWKNQTVLKIRSHLSLDFNCPICYTLQPHFDDFNNEGGVVYDIYWQWQCKGDHNTLQYMSNKMFLLWIGLRSDAE